MTAWRVTIDCEDADIAMRVLRAAMVYDITLQPPQLIELTDDEVAADISELTNNRVLSLLDQAIASIEVTDTDPTPPHGIERPRRVGRPMERPAKYFVLRRNVTQGSAPYIEGLETVPCVACGAGSGEVCITAKNEGYRQGYGHMARRKAFDEVTR